MNQDLPRTCIPVPKIEDDSYDWWKRHEDKLEYGKNHRSKVVFLGDSITHFWTGESGPDYGDGLWAELSGKLPIWNLGYGFDRTQNVLWRIENGELDGQNPELLVVNIGTNQFSITERYDGDTPENAAAGIRCVLRALHEKFPAALILTMALFPRGGKFSEISETNRLLYATVGTMPSVKLIDLTHKLGDTEGNPVSHFYQPDFCHINRAGYEIWAQALAPYLHPFETDAGLLQQEAEN